MCFPVSYAPKYSVEDVAIRLKILFDGAVGVGNGGYVKSGFFRMNLKEITTGLNLTGVEPTQIVNVVATVPLGDGLMAR